MTDKPEPCPECGHAAGEEGDLLTIAYMAGVYDERKARENADAPRRQDEVAQLRTALHDAINAPKGVIPASAEPFYDPRRAAMDALLSGDADLI